MAYSSAQKVYVTVTVRYDADGGVSPLSFVWEDGRHYEIDRVLDVRPAASLRAGGTGLRYTCRVRGRETYLYFDTFEDRWFMERRKAKL